jgi:hypothetical protein
MQQYVNDDSHEFVAFFTRYQRGFISARVRKSHDSKVNAYRWTQTVANIPKLLGNAANSMSQQFMMVR